MEPKDSESTDAANVDVRLFVNDTSLGEGDTSSALTKHFSSFAKVTEIISTGPGMSLVYLRGKRAVVENMQKLNGGGSECVVEGGCKIEVDAVFPLNTGRRTPLRPCKPIPGFYVLRAIQRAADEKAKMAKEPKIMLTKKPEPMKAKMAKDPKLMLSRKPEPMKAKMAKEPKIMLSKKPEPMKAKMAKEPKIMLSKKPEPVKAKKKAKK